jgi:type II secretory pathway component PulM
MTALALSSAELYVAAAYVVFVALVVVYVVIIQARFARASSQVEALSRLVREDDSR